MLDGHGWKIDEVGIVEVFVEFFLNLTMNDDSMTQLAKQGHGWKKCNGQSQGRSYLQICNGGTLGSDVHLTTCNLL